jgi:uncharacterized protein
MQKIIQLKLLPSEAATDSGIKEASALAIGQAAKDITHFTIIKRSIDARGRQAWIILTLRLFVNEPLQEEAGKILQSQFRDVSNAPSSVIIIGAGPAGLFAALRLIEDGIQPILLERGKDVRARRRDLATLNKEGIVNPESNYCFGEGGAGTYSDGKLYTRSSKRGNINRILHLFEFFGADKNILFDAHPHIGTNKLPQIITRIRQQILECGGIFLFQKKVVDFIVKDGCLKGVKTADGELFEGNAYILSTGHSARDIFQLLQQKGIHIETKPFAVGIRIEHPQNLIDNIQYHGDLTGNSLTERDPFLPPAAYSLVEQVEGRGVFSFCMCPGGIIAPAATAPGELVVNGWSPSKRNNPYANSGIVVTIGENDLKDFKIHGSLAGMHFQRSIEENAYQQGGGKLIAPAQRMVDFVENRISTNLPACSYVPGLHSVRLKESLPDFLYQGLRKALVKFGKKMKGYYSNDAVLLSTESRTSSPVRVPRDSIQLSHPQISNLYPCGEGAGYAGGIVSAAMDGESVAGAIALKLR